MSGVAGVVLAAGAGRRFGMPKALVRLPDGLLVDRAARVLAEGGCDPVLAILGAAEDEVRAQAQLDGVRVVSNPEWSSGMGSSVRVALASLVGTEVDAALVLPVDMPGITAESVRRVAALRSPSVLAAAAHGGERSHPVLLGREHWAGVIDSARGDSGARDYLKARTVTMVSCDDISDGSDIDRPEDLERTDT